MRATGEQHAGADWSQLSAALTEGAVPAGIDSHIVEQFIEHLTTNDPSPAETIAHMVALAADLPAHYRQATATPGESAWQHGGHDTAGGFVGHVEGQADNAAADSPEPYDVSNFPEVKPGDSGEWVGYLDTMLTSHGF